jgi:hypothetical protein
VKNGYNGRPRSEVGGVNAGGKALIGDVGEELSSESTGDGLRTGMDLCWTTERKDLVVFV